MIVDDQNLLEVTAQNGTKVFDNAIAGDIQTRARSGSSWQVAGTKPTFTDGVLDAGSAKVAFTAPETHKLSETEMLTVTLFACQLL